MLLTGKSKKRYEHGIPPQEIKDIFIRKLIEEGKEKLPDTMNELVVKTEQILLQPRKFMILKVKECLKIM